MLIEAYRQRALEIEREISKLIEECREIEATKRRLNKQNEITGSRDRICRIVENVCGLNGNLQIMEDFRQAVMGELYGSKMDALMSQMDELCYSIENKRNQKYNRIESLNLQLQEVNNMLLHSQDGRGGE